MHNTAVTQAVRLDGGAELVIRSVRPSDAEEIAAFLEGLSPESRELRYHSPVPVVRWWMVESVAAADHDQREALVALLGGRVVGVAEWGRDPEVQDRAHVGIAVDESVRRRGIAQTLMRRLGDLAREHGYREFVATVLTVNRPVFKLIERMTPQARRLFDGDEVEVLIPLTAAS